VLDELGGWVVDAGRRWSAWSAFLGVVADRFYARHPHPRRFRLNAVIQRFDLVGVRALGIIGLMSFLIGS
jgi:phospholipid/cholesterol/gamma-HCH transport system permease protein